MSKQFYTVSEGQTLMDIALEVYGDIAGVFTLIEQNPELSRVDEPLSPGQQLFTDSSLAIDDDIALYFRSGDVKINSRGNEIAEEEINQDGLRSSEGILLITLDNKVLIPNPLEQ